MHPPQIHGGTQTLSKFLATGIPTLAVQPRLWGRYVHLQSILSFIEVTQPPHPLPYHTILPPLPSKDGETPTESKAKPINE